mgnify:CR=1 FL=1
MAVERTPSLLILRRDNIGDLACTTPLVEAIRQRLLDANVALPPVLAEASPSALSEIGRAHV